MLIRDERDGDEDSIRAIIIAAFRDKSFSHQTEHLIVDSLREQDALTVSLVADDDGFVVGHVAFSPITIGERSVGWHALGPVAVAPERQGAGVGSALIRAGLARMTGMGSRGCALLGASAYYGRFGFRHDPRLTVDGIPAGDCLVLPFSDAVPEGKIAFHPAFDVTSSPAA